MVQVKDVPFPIKVVGDTTFQEYGGQFRARQLLNHDQQLERDRIRRELLGDKPEQATDRAKNQATIFAELAVRLTEAPAFWTASRNGLDLYDDNVVGAVYAEAMAVEMKFREELQKKAEEAKAALEKMAPKAE